ncbi:unnamed protein product [Acanthoscelides obtectus]|uniref:RING-type E3 ubiquitin transferase n=1 Tax=Acanthoscelides obtectus TaxID=200917 RepID=A0A9P0NY06_ACAOB|nr:unnamed protein product [Acanthoscelides obtectus]CAK1668037.1 Peroxisome biogenesis factor 10 [Acanthoscelides obtectus]
MKLYNAKVVDILRLHQKDEEFLNGVQSDIHSILKHTGPRNYYKLSKSVPTIANVWYYCMTTLGNLQTLGEEYTGTIRVGSDGKIPSKTLQVLWLILYVGGDPLVERLLSHSKQKIKNSTTITKDAKEFLIVCLDFFKKEKVTLRSIHNSLFYMDGAFYNISNRLTGLRYVLLRDWLQDNSYTTSFKLLGNISLFYVLYNFISRLFSPIKEETEFEDIEQANICDKGCLLCGQKLKSPSTTPCGHIFCWSCIYESLEYQHVCPICRETTKPSRIVLLQNYG